MLLCTLNEWLGGSFWGPYKPFWGPYKRVWGTYKRFLGHSSHPPSPPHCTPPAPKTFPSFGKGSGSGSASRLLPADGKKLNLDRKGPYKPFWGPYKRVLGTYKRFWGHSSHPPTPTHCTPPAPKTFPSFQRGPDGETTSSLFPNNEKKTNLPQNASKPMCSLPPRPPLPSAAYRPG